MPFPSTQYSVNYIALTLDNTDNTLTTSNSLDQPCIVCFNLSTPLKATRQRNILNFMIQFSHIRNLRDVGGVPAEGGALLRKRRIYRSAELFDATASECIRLTDRFNLGTVIDLRTSLECNRRPDPIMPGVESVHIPLMPASALGISFQDGNLRELLTGTWNPDTYDVCTIYRSMVDKRLADKWQQLFRTLLASNGKAVLFHCTNGKDRTGVAVSIVLLALGVSYNDVICTTIYAQTVVYRHYKRAYRQKWHGALSRDSPTKSDHF